MYTVCAGDVIFARGRFCDHYGIYAGNRRVVHFWDGGDGGMSRRFYSKRRASVRADSLDFFRAPGERCYVVKFPDTLDTPGALLMDQTHTIPCKNFCTGISASVPVFGTALLGISLLGVLLSEYLDRGRRKRHADYRLYDNATTLERASSHVGKNNEEYNLFFNNCEHFAVWCKTGIRESSQVGRVLDALVGYGKLFREIGEWTTVQRE